MQIINVLTVCKKQNAFLQIRISHYYLCMLMAIVDLIYLIIALYILYKLIFSFILPVAKAATSVRDQVRSAQNDQPDRQFKSNSYSSAQPDKKKKSAPTDSEYIDFEEIKS